MSLLDNIPYEAFFAIYLIIASNYYGELFGCKFRKLLTDNMFLKHVLAFMTFGFLVILTGIDISKSDDIIASIIYTVVFYLWFVMSTKTHIYITIIIVLLFFTMYVISYRIKFLKNNEEYQNKEKVDELIKINNYLLLVTFIITIWGFINYLYLKYCEYNKEFNLIKFILGDSKCRNDKLDHPWKFTCSS
jgi:hypothetical protein